VYVIHGSRVYTGPAKIKYVNVIATSGCGSATLITFDEQSNGRRAAVESKSNRSCNHRVTRSAVTVYVTVVVSQCRPECPSRVTENLRRCADDELQRNPGIVSFSKLTHVLRTKYNHINYLLPQVWFTQTGYFTYYLKYIYRFAKWLIPELPV